MILCWCMCVCTVFQRGQNNHIISNYRKIKLYQTNPNPIPHKGVCELLLFWKNIVPISGQHQTLGPSDEARSPGFGEREVCHHLIPDLLRKKIAGRSPVPRTNPPSCSGCWMISLVLIHLHKSPEFAVGGSMRMILILLLMMKTNCHWHHHNLHSKLHVPRSAEATIRLWTASGAWWQLNSHQHGNLEKAWHGMTRYAKHLQKGMQT